MNQLIHTRLYGLLTMAALLCSTAHAARTTSLEKKTPGRPVTRAVAATTVAALGPSVYDQANNILYLGAPVGAGDNSLISVTAEVSSLTDLIGVDATTEATNFAGRPVRDTASGAWVVPGSWGVRVNE